MTGISTLTPVVEDRCLTTASSELSESRQESEWVAECRSGSLPAFELLYDRHSPRMKSIAMNILGNASDAEDAVQECFLKIYRRISEFRGDAAFSTWVFRVLVNTCYDLSRKRRRLREDPHAEPTGEALLPVAPSDHPLRLTLERVLRELDPRSRTVFLLFEVEGFRHREIAEILDIREGTSKSLLFEAKRKLQRLVTAGSPESRGSKP